MERPTVVIITDDPAFANALTRRWLAERETPTFVVMEGGSDFKSALDFDLAVLVGVATEPRAAALETLKRTGKPIILVSSANENPPRAWNLTALPDVREWPDLVLLLAGQILQRERISRQLDRFQELNAVLQHEALLGRYMLEVRHNLNNALTSLLGNSDLILVDEDQMTPPLRSQVETIRNMGMRINEIMQRFSSLQKEMRLIEQQTNRKAAAAAAGS